MATKFILDTHALIWHLEGNKLLGRSARRVIDDPSSDLFLPIIALAEACFVVEKGRTTIPSVSNLIDDVNNDRRIDIVPLTEEILIKSITLTSISEIHDRLIIATGLDLRSRGETVEILTTDNEIIRSGLIAVTWS